MIRRETEEGWILITQDDHALLSFDIMKNWGNSKFEEIVPQNDVLTAIKEHDCGWKEWDSKPVLNKHNHYPKNFMEMYTKDQYVIWKSSYESLSENCKYAASLVALHFAKFNNHTLSKNPDNRTAKILREKINQFVNNNLNLHLNGNHQNGYLPIDVRINLRFLQIGDILSLALCHGWSSTEIENVPLNYYDDTVLLKFNSDDGLNYNIVPNPFSENEFNFSIRGKKLFGKNFKNQDELDKAFDDAIEQDLIFKISG